MSGKVYIVSAMDTEGPIRDPRKPEILDTWERVDSLVERMTAKAFRFKYPDSAGEGLKYSWFILHLTGFKTNPFDRPMGYNLVFDHYVEKFQKTIAENRDGIYWHYHQPAPSGIGNEWCRDWTHCTEYHQVLSHLVLDRGFFPSCFRAGGRIEDDDLSNWLEQWIPFDYSNNSGDVNWEKRESDGKRLIDVCDWTRASQSWFPYHPSTKDYQQPGDQKRWMFRCPDLNSPVHVLTDQEIEKAFRQAQDGQDAVLAFFEHDRRDNTLTHFEDVARRISDVGKKFSSVQWFYKNALDAAQELLGLERQDDLQFEAKVQGDRILISARGPLFGYAPYVCLKQSESYQEIAVHTIGQQKWITGPLDFNSVDKIGIAANSVNGNSCVKILEANVFNKTSSENLIKIN